MTFRFFSYSTLLHLAWISVVYVSTYWFVGRNSDQVRPLEPLHIVDLGGPVQPHGADRGSQAGPLIRTPAIKIPIFHYPPAAVEASQSVPTVSARIRAAPGSKPSSSQAVKNKPASQRPVASATTAPESTRTWVKPDSASELIRQGASLASASGSGVTGDYESVLLSRIKSALDYYRAGRNDLVAIVSFSIGNAEHPVQVALERGSGDSAFDAAVREAVSRLELKPVPKEFLGHRLSVNIKSED